MKISIACLLFLPLWFNVPLRAQETDYAKTKNWLALPEKIDHADLVPLQSALKERQKMAEADVFYIHPTTYYRGATINERNFRPSIKRTNKNTLASQASAFNACFNIYAPYYKQASLYILRKNNVKTQKALHVAYADIKCAFAHYLQHYNQNRPFVLVAHGQGSLHAYRLIEEIIDKSELKERFIAGYLAGQVIVKNQLDSAFVHVSYCDSAVQTGCLLNWQTLGANGYYQDMLNNTLLYNKGRYQKLDSGNRLCTNPVSWTTDTALVSKHLHAGSVKWKSHKQELEVVMQNYLETKVSNGFVYIDKPKGALFNASGKNYHKFDYNLFYLNIRANACARLAVWQKSH